MKLRIGTDGIIRNDSDGQPFLYGAFYASVQAHTKPVGVLAQHIPYPFVVIGADGSATEFKAYDFLLRKTDGTVTGGVAAEQFTADYTLDNSGPGAITGRPAIQPTPFNPDVT
jgi:hypothetical protein